MYQLTSAFIPQWTEDSPFRAPVRVDTICPHCGLSMVFDLKPWAWTESRTSGSTEAICTSCGKPVSFFASTGGQEGSGDATYFMHPSPDFLRQPLADISRVKEFDEALQRAYAASINVYNAREWTGTAVVCRRTLEDIAKALLPADQRKLSLALQIEALPRRRDLARPMLLLSDALKRTGSLGAYFDLEKIPDRHAATLIIDLLEYLIQYLFLIPQRIEHLHNEVRALAEPPQKEQ